MPLEKTDSGKVIVPNGELYYEKLGDGKPLILIHAGFSDRRDWMHQISDFGKKYNTIAYDQRGSGNSSVIKTEFSPADDLKAITDYLKIEKAYLVGHSIGGTIAIDFALQYPEKISALILVASGLNGYSWSKEYIELMGAIWSVPQPEEMTKQFLSAPFYSVSMNEPSIKFDIDTITKESFQKVLTWETFDIRDVHWYFPDSISKLKELKVPTLVIYGDKDSEDIKKIAQLLSKNIQNVKAVQIKNTDHLLNFGKPDELNKIVLDFISDIT
jgi:pimeloyl-ACP methyl ester carboxylesterase